LVEVREVLEGASSGQIWRLKTRFGFAGRGQRSCVGDLGEVDETWIEMRLQEDRSLWMEPEVEVLDAFSLHGWVSPEGGYRLGRLLRQFIGDGGTWNGAEIAKDGPDGEMREAAGIVAEGLRMEGYFGPFGIDGISWRKGKEQGFCPLLECNARMTMAFGLGFPMGGIPEIS
jgi:hypothetical protein